MFRAAVLSIVATLLAGPSASLVCSAWCHPLVATSATCEHPNEAASTVTATDNCPDIAAVTTAFVQEDVRRGVVAPDGQPSLNVPWFPFVMPPKSGALDREPGQHRPHELRPFLLALRL